MSSSDVPPTPVPAATKGSAAHDHRAFLSAATIIGALTFVSRLLGAARESVAAAAFGAGGVWSAWTVAFTVPNLFRKLFGEGALSAAFIPLYSQAVKAEKQGTEARTSRGGHGGTEGKAEEAAGTTGLSSPSVPQCLSAPPHSSVPSPSALSSHDFAVASVNLLCMILLALTVLGELVLLGLYFLLSRPDHLLAVKFSAVMLPYVLLVCGTAFLGAILQVHARFAAVAATSIVLNAVTIVAILLAGWFYDLRELTGQVAGGYFLSVAVLVAGLVQVLMLVPSLRQIGFRFRPVLHVFTPAVKQMLWFSLPVALGAGVLQVGVLLDKGIALFLAEGGGATTFSMFGHTVAYPMAEGAAARLNWAQFMYQFPLGVFAIAVATAIFPKLAGDALDADKTAFRAALRKGISASLFVGLPASVGMVLVADPAVRVLLQHGKLTPADADWIILSTRIYSAAIWAFSLQQILNRAYYALHDSRTPLIWAAVNLAINLVVEIPLLWTPLRESGMAVGTLVSFAIQSVVMTWFLSRRIGGLGLRAELRPLAVMTVASLLMGLACWGVMHLPIYPTTAGKLAWTTQLALQITTGIAVYAALCRLGGIDVLAVLRRRKRG